MLRQVGVPLPAGRMVKSAREAWQAAQEIGLPVVVKPMDGNQGKGVSVNLNSKAEVSEAFAITRQYSRQILVESYIEGHDFRLLVISGRLVAAAQPRSSVMVVQPGDRLIVICDEVSEALDMLHTVAESISEDAICINPLTLEKSLLPHREKNGVPVLTSMSR